jgi:transcriptional regulator GlxA family with amidase domain
MSDAPKLLGVILYPEFELLDVFGPLEMFGSVRGPVEIKMVGERPGAVASAQGPASVVDYDFAGAPAFDLLLIPGGFGTRAELENPAMLDFLRRQAAHAEIVMTVCTGSALLARAGLLDGRRATTNKMFFAWVAEQGPKVRWVREARWVDDGKFVTSSGVSAGMDMALAVIARLFGPEVAGNVAVSTEYEWHRDPAWDPFARLHGLVV